MKNLFILLFVYLVRLCTKTSIKINGQEKKILIVSTTALGDTVWATPAIQCLKETFPNAEIHILTSGIGKQALKDNPAIHKIFSLSSNTLFSLMRLYTVMKKENYDTALIFHTSQRSIVPFCSMLKIPEIIGTAGMSKGLDRLFSKLSDKKQVHEVERRLEIVKLMGAQISPKKLQIFWTKADEEKLELVLAKHGIDKAKPLIALHPGAKDKFKQWPVENFIQLGKLLAENIPCQILITGTPPEKDLVASIASGIPGSIPLTHDLSLKSFAALIQRLDALVINDTGPMHIAFALNTPTVAIFCPTNPSLCGPHFPLENVEICYEAPTCTPCLRKKCREPFCLYQISPKKVFQSLLEVKKRKK